MDNWCSCLKWMSGVVACLVVWCGIWCGGLVMCGCAMWLSRVALWRGCRVVVCLVV